MLRNIRLASASPSAAGRVAEVPALCDYQPAELLCRFKSWPYRSDHLNMSHSKGPKNEAQGLIIHLVIAI